MIDREILEAYREESFKGTMRAQRAKRTASQILQLVGEFVPRERECHQRLYDYLIQEAFRANAEFTSVPPECDHLDKLALEHKRLEQAMAPIVVKTTELPSGERSDA